MTWKSLIHFSAEWAKAYIFWLTFHSSQSRHTMMSRESHTSAVANGDITLSIMIYLQFWLCIDIDIDKELDIEIELDRVRHRIRQTYH